MRLLLVEDNQTLALELMQKLKRDGFAVDVTHNGKDAQYLGQHETYDIIILDLGLPDISGFLVLQHWRNENIDIPVLILTARDAWEEKVDGLKASADDYLTKPFHYPELLARLQALIRRSKGQKKPQIQSQNFYLDEASQTVMFSDGKQEPLTGTEFKLLRFMLLNPGKILSKSTLTEHVYAYDADKDSNVIEVYIRRLRDKIGKHLITTKRGQGYVFTEAP